MKHIGRAATGLALTTLLLSSVSLGRPQDRSRAGRQRPMLQAVVGADQVLPVGEEAGPYRIALVNGFVGNTWRIQMIKTAKAFAEQPGIKENIKEFKVVSTGTDVAAQLGAIEDFINQGFDAIVTIAVAPDGFDRVIRLADKNNVVVVPFDNILDTDKVMMVNEDQNEMGRMSAKWLIEEIGQEGRQDPRSARPARQLGRPRPPCRLPRGHGSAPATSSRSSRWSATGTPARRRR